MLCLVHNIITNTPIIIPQHLQFACTLCWRIHTHQRRLIQVIQSIESTLGEPGMRSFASTSCLHSSSTSRCAGGQIILQAAHAFCSSRPHHHLQLQPCVSSNPNSHRGLQLLRQHVQRVWVQQTNSSLEQEDTQHAADLQQQEPQPQQSELPDANAQQHSSHLEQQQQRLDQQHDSVAAAAAGGDQGAAHDAAAAAADSAPEHSLTSSSNTAADNSSSSELSPVPKQTYTYFYTHTWPHVAEPVPVQLPPPEAHDSTNNATTSDSSGITEGSSSNTDSSSSSCCMEPVKPFFNYAKYFPPSFLRYYPAPPGSSYNYLSFLGEVSR